MGTIDVYSEVLTRLVTETLQCSPQSWTQGTLSIESDGTRLTYRLKNEDSPDKAVISETLRDLIDELYVRMARDGNAWLGAQVAFTRENGQVTFDTKFQHAPAKPRPVAPAAAKRPWWKFGG